MKEAMVVFAVALCGVGTDAGLASAGEPKVKQQTAALMVSLHRLHEGEIQISSIVAEHAPSEDVRGFAARVRRDHQELDRRLFELAAKLDVDLQPQVPKEAARGEPASDELDALIERLEQARGAELDRLFLIGIIKLNESEIRRLRESSLHVTHEKVRRYVERVTGVLASHAERARALRRTVAQR